MARKGERRDRIVNGKPLFSNQIICSATGRGAIVHGGGERGRRGPRVKRRRRKMAVVVGQGRTGARQQVCIRSSPSTLPNGLAHLFYIRPIGIGWRSFTEGLTLKGWLLIKYTVQEYHFGILGS